MKLKVKDMTLSAILAAVMFVSQIALSFLPNIELVSLLVILYTLLLRKKVFYIIYVFAFLEYLVYGFGLWWLMYLYVWTILALAVLLLKSCSSPLFYAILSGIYGLLFGFFCSFPYFLTAGIAGGIAYWIAGIPFDILHGISNFVIALVLFSPLSRLFIKLLRQETSDSMS